MAELAKWRVLGFLVVLAPSVANAQGQPLCGTDSVFARRYGAHLQSTFRNNAAEKATVTWLSDSAACHSAMRIDSSGPGHRLYVYSFARAGVLRYGILSVPPPQAKDRKSTRLNSSHTVISYAVF